MRINGMPKGAGKDAPKSTKLEDIPRQLITAKNLNRFEAEHQDHHSLNTTISTLQNEDGILIDRERKTASCLNGAATVNVNKYWPNTSPENIKRAKILLSSWEL
jgi:hypothetical protein